MGGKEKCDDKVGAGKLASVDDSAGSGLGAKAWARVGLGWTPIARIKTQTNNTEYRLRTAQVIICLGPNQ